MTQTSNIYQTLKQGGFSNEEIRGHLQPKLENAGFMDQEINDYFARQEQAVSAQPEDGQPGQGMFHSAFTEPALDGPRLQSGQGEGSQPGRAMFQISPTPWESARWQADQELMDIMAQGEKNGTLHELLDPASPKYVVPGIVLRAMNSVRCLSTESGGMAQCNAAEGGLMDSRAIRQNALGVDRRELMAVGNELPLSWIRESGLSAHLLGMSDTPLEDPALRNKLENALGRKMFYNTPEEFEASPDYHKDIEWYPGMTIAGAKSTVDALERHRRQTAEVEGGTGQGGGQEEADDLETFRTMQALDGENYPQDPRITMGMLAHAPAGIVKGFCDTVKYVLGGQILDDAGTVYDLVASGQETPLSLGAKAVHGIEKDVTDFREAFEAAEDDPWKQGAMLGESLGHIAGGGFAGGGLARVARTTLKMATKAAFGVQAAYAAEGTGNVAAVAKRAAKTVGGADDAAQGSLTGKPAHIYKNADAETVRALTRENEAARILADKGYHVEQRSVVPGSKNPDYRINGVIFDCYSPKTDNPRSIWGGTLKKIKDQQTDNVIINLADSTVDVDVLKKQFLSYPIEGLEQLWIVTRLGDIIKIK